MQNIKHVGRILNTGRKCIVVFREIPGDETNCLVVDTDRLPDRYHDDIMAAVQSITAQEANNFYEYATRQLFSDGNNMLTSMHTNRWLDKHPDWNIVLTPNPNQEIKLSDLNRMVKEQQGSQPEQEQQAQKEIKKDENFDENKFKAKDLIVQATLLEEDAVRIRNEAYTLDPSLKPKTTKRSTSTKKTISQKKTEPATTAS